MSATRLARTQRKPLDPVEYMKRMRRMPAAPGAAARLAELPPWDGKVRFYLQCPYTGRVDDAPWSDEEIHYEAWRNLRNMVAGYGIGGTKDDPNDPPIVTKDIREHPNDPWH